MEHPTTESTQRPSKLNRDLHDSSKQIHPVPKITDNFRVAIYKLS